MTDLIILAFLGAINIAIVLIYKKRIKEIEKEKHHLKFKSEGLEKERDRLASQIEYMRRENYIEPLRKEKERRQEVRRSILNQLTK